MSPSSTDTYIVSLQLKGKGREEEEVLVEDPTGEVQVSGCVWQDTTFSGKMKASHVQQWNSVVCSEAVMRDNEATRKSKEE